MMLREKVTSFSSLALQALREEAEVDFMIKKIIKKLFCSGGRACGQSRCF